MLPELFLYSTDHCKLCIDALVEFKNHQRQTPFLIREIKLTPAASNYNKFKEMVPVFMVNEEVVGFGHVNFDDIKQKLFVKG